MDTVLRILQMLSYASVLLGIPLALLQYFLVKRREKRDREYGTYNALDERYLEFQKLCLQHPYLDTFDVPDAKPETLSDQQKKEELIVFTMLFSIFERSFLMYYDQSTEIKRKQWSGWDEYIRSYCARPNFRAAWLKSGTTFDTDYQAYMSTMLGRIVPAEEATADTTSRQTAPK